MTRKSGSRRGGDLAGGGEAIEEQGERRQEAQSGGGEEQWAKRGSVGWLGGMEEVGHSYAEKCSTIEWCRRSKQLSATCSRIRASEHSHPLPLPP
jgi:hypothetical protein